MLVAQVMTRDVKTCVASDSLDRPAHLMLAHDIGCVPVVDGEGRAIGLVTDRDLCMAGFVSGRPLHELSVERTMTGVAHVVGEADALEGAHSAMRDHAVRRLPVVDADGRLTGLLTLSDLVQCAPFMAKASLRKLAVEQLLGTLQVVTRPRETDLGERYAAVKAPSKARRSASKDKQGKLALQPLSSESKATRSKARKSNKSTTKKTSTRKAAKPTAAKKKVTKQVAKKSGPKKRAVAKKGVAKQVAKKTVVKKASKSKPAKKAGAKGRGKAVVSAPAKRVAKRVAKSRKVSGRGAAARG